MLWHRQNFSLLTYKFIYYELPGKLCFSGYVNPCPEGKPALTVTGTPYPCTRLTATSLQCPANHWCHVGITVDMTLCCPGCELFFIK